MPATPTNTKPGARQDSERRKAADLDSRYGNIGISAVAAALRYGGETKNTRHAPAAPAPWRAHDDAA